MFIYTMNDIIFVAIILIFIFTLAAIILYQYIQKFISKIKNKKDNRRKWNTRN